MITATLRVTVPAHRRSEVLDLLRSVIEPTQVEPGCLSCRLYQDLENEEALLFEEEWKTQADLDRHIRSDRYVQILAAIDMSSKPPEIRFNTIARTKGIEAIRAARVKPAEPGEWPDIVEQRD
ncbi:MAG: antibiotic biosynthesis monooxygenase [Deltaproteobacteria bacterium]|nr:antibiotic biosynthesis monooxygenase [Deltaproteobacteria bacterium]